MSEPCSKCSRLVTIPQPFDFDGLVICPSCLLAVLDADPDLPDPRLVSYDHYLWGGYPENIAYQRQLKEYLDQEMRED